MWNDDDPEAEDFLTDRQPGEPDVRSVRATAAALKARFGREAPLRAELLARDALAHGDRAAYRLFKQVETAVEELFWSASTQDRQATAAG